MEVRSFKKAVSPTIRFHLFLFDLQRNLLIFNGSPLLRNKDAISLFFLPYSFMLTLLRLLRSPFL